MTPLSAQALAALEERAAGGEVPKLREIIKTINLNMRCVTLCIDVPADMETLTILEGLKSQDVYEMAIESLLADATRALHLMAGISKEQFLRIIQVANDLRYSETVTSSYDGDPEQIRKNAVSAYGKIFDEVVNPKPSLPTGPSDAELILWAIGNSKQIEDLPDYPFIYQDYDNGKCIWYFMENMEAIPSLCGKGEPLTIDNEARAILRAAFENKGGEKR